MVHIILTEFINYRGKSKRVDELNKASTIKVEVLCPDCKSIINAGHYFCLKCIRKLKQRKYLDVGTVYGKLCILNQSEKSGFSVCKCSCGEIKEIYNYSLVSGKTNSCGCLKKENLINVKRVRGEKHGMWKGGTSSQRERLMQSTLYKDWRKLVFERDDYTCQCCDKIGGSLNAHHIVNFSESDILRVDASNGITLCKDCHVLFHSKYGRKQNNKQQILEFIK